MKVSLDKWLLAQCGREDEIGKLARSWASDSRPNKAKDFDDWLSEIEKAPGWVAVVSQAKNEHSAALKFLSLGRTAPTFPRIFASNDFERQLQKSFDKHRGQSEVSADAYLRQKHFGLQKAMQERTLIYLDTNHWINLRHVFLGSRHAREEYAEMFVLLNDLAKKERALCPVSFPLFLELMKQSDLDTRRATAELMDAFSGGVCLQYPYELQKLEFRQSALRSLLGEKAPDLKEWIWTKVGYLGGEMLPFSKAFSDSVNTMVRKVCIDGMWTIPLEHFLELDGRELDGHAEELMAAATNKDAAWYREAKTPFAEVLVQEKAYLVRRLTDDIKLIIQEIWNDYPDHRDVSKLPSIKEGELNPWTLPSIQVLAGINATLLVSPKKFSANDILDFQHAALAVPYCDALFCDNPMAHILRTKPLEFGTIYESTILSRPEEMLRYLRGLEM